MSRALGIDVGTVRVGVAVSDPLGIIAQPLEVIDRRHIDPHERIALLVREHEVERIVVGYPLQLDGQPGLAARATDDFIAALAAKLETKIPIERWDERLSTAEAERSMIAGGARRARRRQSIDKIAAAIILQSYLDARRHGI